MKMLIALAALSATPAYAAPAYLDCILQGDKPLEVQITSDEDNQTVTINIPSTGHAEKRPAVFSPTEVNFETPLTFGSIGYRISRTDLTITRTIATPTSIVGTTPGKCTVQQPPVRAF